MMNLKNFMHMIIGLEYWIVKFMDALTCIGNLEFHGENLNLIYSILSVHNVNRF